MWIYLHVSMTAAPECKKPPVLMTFPYQKSAAMSLASEKDQIKQKRDLHVERLRARQNNAISIKAMHTWVVEFMPDLRGCAVHRC